MKKIILLFTFILSISLITGCKKDKKEVIQQPELENTKTYSVIGETSTIKWVAYKTTDKVPVKGNFQTIKVTNSKSAATVEEALNGILFSIPVSSLMTKDPTRDGKLKEFFFGVMDNTEFISGTFNVSDKESSVNLTMNGVTKTIPIELNIDGQMVTFTNTINLNDWNLQSALESINKACFDLHKGPDGVSKTWDEVEIKAVIYLKVNN